MADVDDLLNELIGKEKPQQPPAEVSSHKEPVVEPDDEAGEPEESPCDDLVYREVPATHVSLRCQSCSSDMEPGEKHWYVNKEDKVYWWCTTCGWEKCNLEPPQE